MNKTLKDKHHRLCKCGTRQTEWADDIPEALSRAHIRNRAMHGHLNKQIFCFNVSHAVCYICFSFPLSFQSYAVTINSFFWCYVHSRGRPGWRNWKKWQRTSVLLYYSHKTAKCVIKYEIMQCAQYFFPPFEPNKLLFRNVLLEKCK